MSMTAFLYFNFSYVLNNVWVFIGQSFYLPGFMGSIIYPIANNNQQSSPAMAANGNCRTFIYAVTHIQNDTFGRHTLEKGNSR